MTLNLKTDRLVLRPFAAQDCAWIADALGNFEVARWIPLLPHPYGIEEARSFVELQTGPNADTVAVMHDGEGIGCMTTAKELGYWFRQSAWGQGFATEAARAVVSGYFDAGHSTLESGYITDNDRSLGVLTKLGFIPTEKVERQSDAHASPVTVQRMVLTRQDWEARR